MTPAAFEIDTELAAQFSQYYADPLGFVMFAYPWGVKENPWGSDHVTGPDKWQRDFLVRLGEEVKHRAFDGKHNVTPIRMAVASGHGIGKSALVAWIIHWIMATRPGAKGTITANTVTQLETRTWARLNEWTDRFIAKHWFRLTTEKLMHIDNEQTWFCSAQTCAEENSEAFAGQQNEGSTSFYIFDEASAVPDKIFEVAEGGLLIGEPMIFLFGNPTRNTGKLHRICWGSEKENWIHWSIDNRTCALGNKEEIARWEEQYGEDSDYFRVRVRGLPPSADELQYIDATRIADAQQREVEALPDEPIVAGFDVSGGGSAWNVIRFRRGLRADVLEPIRITGERGRDRAVLVAKAAEVLRDTRSTHKIAAMFVDSAFGAPIVERLHTLGYDNAIEVNFGGPAPDRHFVNQRAYMWAKLKDWLLRGRIDESADLALGLGGPGYHLNRSNQLVLESKQDMQKRGVASPDDADALALTFAQPVAPIQPEEWPTQPRERLSEDSWMA